MKKLVIILGIITATLAVILSVLPLSNLTYIPAIAALIFGLIATYMTRDNKESKKIIHLLLLITIISLAIATYKSIFNTVEIGNTEQLEEREKESEEKAIEELEDLGL